MNYIKKLIICIFLFFICFMILRYLAKNSNESMFVFGHRRGCGCGCNCVGPCSSNCNCGGRCGWENFENRSTGPDVGGWGFGSYSYDSYMSKKSLDNARYRYPVHFDKNYKNFSDPRINYNDVYDAYYKNTQTKDN